MGLPVADWTDCRQKCRCKDGENEGRFYTVEKPCPFGYTFDEEACDCGTPCEWCDKPAEFGDVNDPENWGVCHKATGEKPKGFQVELEGRLDGYIRYWPYERCCAPRFPSLFNTGGKEYNEDCIFDLEYFTTWEGPQLIYRVPCTAQTTACRPFELRYDYRPAGCDAQRLPENNPWKEGAFGFLWLVDSSKSPGDNGYQLVQILYPPGGTLLYNGSYWVGEVAIKISCYY